VLVHWVGTPGYSCGTVRVTGVRGGCGTAEGGAWRCCLAGFYVSGAAGSNECPAGSVRIEAEAACRTAAAAAGKTPAYYFVGTYSDEPRGCYYFAAGNEALFNTHAVGAGLSGSQLLCAALATTAGAPLKRRRRTDARSACTGARAGRHRAGAVRHSRAVCVTHGRHVDRCAHIYKQVHIHIYIPV
jgi:hypothetical protein